MHLNSCITCGCVIRNIKESKSCASCKKHIHNDCDTSVDSDSIYTCFTCQEKTLIDGETSDAIISCVSTDNSDSKFFLSGAGGLELDDDEMELNRSSPSNLRRHLTRSSTRRVSSPSESNIFINNSENSNPAMSHTSTKDIIENEALFNSENSLHNPSLMNINILTKISSPTLTNKSAEESFIEDSTLINNTESQVSDNDEYKPPTSKQTSRNNNRISQERKKSSFSRQTLSMRTRSGGKPPTTSYANIGYEEKDEKNERSKRSGGRLSVNKGKGNRGGRRSSAANSFTKNEDYNFNEYLQQSLEKTKNVKNILKSSNSVPTGVDENDYIRTAIVTNAANNFMNSISLCLICGSVGKDLEGSMVTCASCAQSYHTFCVGMHDKLNSTVLKRGWRCLDCTVCEGCGDGKDESNLLLCDECDVSFHIYCLDPPLERIPQGSWRCEWCAMCCRCNKKVQSSLDLQRLEGLCETCYSLRKCLKCNKLYEVGELLIKCQRCIRWFHAKCEDLITEDQAENAAENAFRCSFCRPQLNDIINMFVIVDNVMIDKSAADYIQSYRRVSNPVNTGIFPDYVTQKNSYENVLDEYDGEDVENNGNYGGHLIPNRGSNRSISLSGGGRGGPGRRMVKIGVGGFNVKIPRHRLLAINAEDSDSLSGFSGTSGNNDELEVALTLNGKPRIRRPRRPRRPQLEDAYPAPIQEFFFGFAAVDSRTLAEQVVDEPVLGEYKRTSLDFFSNKTGCELSEHSSELLRQEQEQDMLGDIFGGGIDLDFDLDLNDIMDGAADDDDGNDENSLIEKSLTDGFSATESTGLITGGMCSPSTSGIGFGESHFGLDNCQSSPRTPNVYKADSASMQHHLQMQQDDQRKRQQQLQSRINMGNTSTTSGCNANNALSQRCNLNKDSNEISLADQRASASSQATERWEEDEPLGDKATKAAVLYANLCHPQLKVKYPQWSERVKQINKEWRTLDAEKRQFYVDMARKNRANSGISRRRTRRLNVLSGNVSTSSSNSGTVNNLLNTQSNADLVNAQVSAIKQAQAQPRFSSEQQKNYGNGNVIEKFKMPSLIRENEVSSLVQENGSTTQCNTLPKTNCENENSDSATKEVDNSETVQLVVRSMIKQQQQIQQRQVILDAENQVFLKRRIAELELEQEEHDNELMKLKKIKKNLTAKQRQLLKCQVKISENNNLVDINSNNSIQSQKIVEQEQTRQKKALFVNEETTEMNRSLEETKRAIQLRTKQSDSCRQEIKEKTVLLQQIEKRQNQTSNVVSDIKVESNNVNVEQNSSSQPYSSSQFNVTNYVSNPINSFNVTSTNSFVVRQFTPINSNAGDKLSHQHQSLTTQSTSSQFVFNSVTKNITPLMTTQVKNFQSTTNCSSTNAQLTSSNQLLTEKLHSRKQLEKKNSSSSLTSSNNQSTLSEICNKSESSNSSFIQKSGRGRKRKKVSIEDQRSPMLGNVAYSSLETQFDRDVYDCVSSLLNQVVSNCDKTTGDSIRRIINSQMSLQSNDSILLTNIGNLQKFDTGEPLKIKKKRQQFKKQIVNDLNEIEQAIERTQSQLDLLRFPKRSLKQFYELDRNVLIYPLITGLPDRPGKMFISGNKLGHLSLLFMPDYYTTIETGKLFKEESLYPKSMIEICAGVNLNALISGNNDDADLCTKEIADEIKDVSDQSFLYQEPDVYFLSTRCLSDRSRIKSSCLLLGPCNPERQLPLEPHRFIFNKEMCDLKEKEFKINMIVNLENIANATELIERLEEILNSKQIIDFQIETPPQSPSLNNNLSYQKEIKLEIDEEMETDLTDNDSSNLQTIKTECKKENAKKCRNCERKIPFLQSTPIEETMSSLGLTPPDDKEMKVSFCSMKCYYNFMVISKVPLSVELLDKAEKYVDEETIEKLRQISADSFAKKIQQTSSEQRMDNNLQTSALLSPMEYQNDQINYFNVSTENLLELMRQPREQVIRASDLQSIVSNKETQNNLASFKGEYKWKGHSWMVCNVSLLHSFQRLHDEVKKRCVSVHLTQQEKNLINCLEDSRICVLCGEQGDGDLELTGRLLNVDANEWIHVNCALWSTEVHETETGALLNVDAAICRAKTVNCLICGKKGASLMCYKLDCKNHASGFHLTCAKRNDGKFIRDKTFYCPEHEVRQEMRVYRFDALRRIYIQREENQLLAKIFNHSYSTEMMMRVGSLIFQKIGQLLPEQLKSFHNENHIFPIGYRVKRIFWSPTNPNDRVHYECFIDDRNNSPEFCVLYEGREFRDSTPSGAWNRILTSVLQAREKAGNMLKFFINQTKGETLFGFTESAITKMTESLPGVDQLYTYTFKHGGSPLMDLPLAVNPSGCARCEPCFRTLIKHRYRPLVSFSPKKKDFYSQSYSFNAEVIPREARSTRSSLSRFHSVSSKIDEETLKAYKASGISEEMLSAPYLRLDLGFGNYQIHSHYRTMQKEWHNNVYLARSKIQGLGLYAKRDINMHAMIIEYKGEVIRSEVGEMREKKYMSQNRGVYMFRIDDEWLIDATLAGGLARYINHSCDPNCSTKILQYNDDKKIIIIANRPIKAGEELTYDYQFELEDTTDKLPCLCGAPNCNKWMN